jgi:Zn-dependent protease with chaperone function
MPVATNSITPQTQKSGVLPPWLWFWLLFYILSVPGIFTALQPSLQGLLYGPGKTVLTQPSFLERMTNVVDFIAPLTVLLGVVAIFFPWLRCARLTNKHSLTEISAMPSATRQETLDTLQEVSDFVQENAPGVRVVYWRDRVSDAAFIYPLGYRRVAIAVSSRLLDLWRTERDTARAILFHEIAHYRHGDTLIIGAGSLLKMVTEHWLLLFSFFFFLPVTLGLVIDEISSFREEIVLGSLSEVLAHHIQVLFTLELPLILSSFFASLFLTAALFTLVLVAIWCAELNADRFVVDTTGSVDLLFDAQKRRMAPMSYWNWLLARMSHPPRRMRKWIVQCSRGPVGLTIFLLLFPAAYFIRLLFLLLWSFSVQIAFLYNGSTISDIIGSLSVGTKYFLEAIASPWFVMTLLFLLWPTLARCWEGIFSRVKGTHSSVNSKGYLLCAGIAACVCVLGYALTFSGQ